MFTGIVNCFLRVTQPSVTQWLYLTVAVHYIDTNASEALL